MNNEIEAAVKPIGRELWQIVRKQGIKSIDVWTAYKEPGTVSVQYTDAEGEIKLLYINCEEE